MKVRCNKYKECDYNKCYHYVEHELQEYDCNSGYCMIIDNSSKCIKIQSTVWSHEEYLLLESLCLMQYFKTKYHLKYVFSWKEIAEILNSKFHNDRTANSCRKQWSTIFGNI